MKTVYNQDRPYYNSIMWAIVGIGLVSPEETTALWRTIRYQVWGDRPYIGNPDARSWNKCDG